MPASSSDSKPALDDDGQVDPPAERQKDQVGRSPVDDGAEKRQEPSQREQNDEAAPALTESDDGWDALLTPLREHRPLKSPPAQYFVLQQDSMITEAGSLAAPPPSLASVPHISTGNAFVAHQPAMDSEQLFEKVLKETSGGLLPGSTSTSGTEATSGIRMGGEEEPVGLGPGTGISRAHVMTCRICQLFVRTVDRLLDKSEELMDHYLPLTEEEIGNLKQAVEELEDTATDHQLQACLLRISNLSSQLRQRAYMLAMSKLRLVRQSTHESVCQLQTTIDLIEQVQKGEEKTVCKSQNKLNELCTHWAQNQKWEDEDEEGEEEGGGEEEEEQEEEGESEVPHPVTGRAEASLSHQQSILKGEKEASYSQHIHRDEAFITLTLPGCEEEDGLPPRPSSKRATYIEPPSTEAKTLEMSRSLLYDLQDMYEGLLRNLKDLPAALKSRLDETCRHMAELRTVFAAANHFGDLTSSLLHRCLDIMGEAQDAMDELMDFAFQHPTSLSFKDSDPAPETERPEDKPETVAGAEEEEREGDILKIQQDYDPKGCEDE